LLAPAGRGFHRGARGARGVASRRGQIPGPCSAPAAVGNSPLQARSNPRPVLRASRGGEFTAPGTVKPPPALGAGRSGEFTAPGAVKSPAHPPRQPRWGIHRSRRGQIPARAPRPPWWGIHRECAEHAELPPDAIKYPAHPRRRPRCGFHRSRHGPTPGPRSARGFQRSRLTAIACAIRLTIRRYTAQPSPKKSFLCCSSFLRSPSAEVRTTDRSVPSHRSPRSPRWKNPSPVLSSISRQ
jgi:hypothetical protein